MINELDENIGNLVTIRTVNLCKSFIPQCQAQDKHVSTRKVSAKYNP